MARGTLEDAIQKMIDNAETALQTAAVLTVQQIEKDFKKAAKDTVDNYYKYVEGGYTKYGRQYSLYNLPLITTSVKKGKGKVSINANILMDADRITGEHKSHGKGAKYADGVSSDYIFNLFMANEHPWTNAWPLNGVEELEYRTIAGEGPKPDKYLNKYINEYGEKYAGAHFEKCVMALLKLYL
jgi:hypothetical protein